MPKAIFIGKKLFCLSRIAVEFRKLVSKLCQMFIIDSSRERELTLGTPNEDFLPKLAVVFRDGRWCCSGNNVLVALMTCTTYSGPRRSINIIGTHVFGMEVSISPAGPERVDYLGFGSIAISRGWQYSTHSEALVQWLE